ncbi:hypothetical protein AMAG_04537 [Allomyces macrogynus ATCC 38327]|uniref:N-acetyltransferase domain-containing protein n=1 Tax=Allomyces macrogynus (strain ATCC 38327) TaxID=578462 RepID=A0A0L0S585_ALLM3|nr:hypothetical protein AMAG_04537 [Allomyces macrogynus ATCC 38327]|eukprot:KNE57677.1 hypothetical protein AMAG_04537 [Allomyces macrogynus ATCC 38327]
MPTDLDATYKLTPLADASPDDVDRFLDLMWVAFRDDPLWSALIADDTDARHKANRWFIEHVRLDGLVAHGQLIRDRETCRVVGHAALIPPAPSDGPVVGTHPVTDEFRAQMEEAVGPAIARRLEKMLSMFGEMDGVVAALHPEVKVPMWVLQAVVVDPEVQGQGIGTWVVRKLLDQNPSVPVILYTQEEHNASWYSTKLAFEESDTREFCIEDDALAKAVKFTNWTMLHVPKAAADGKGKEVARAWKVDYSCSCIVQ